MAKSRSFGDRNKIVGKLAQCDKVKQKKISVYGGLEDPFKKGQKGP